MKLSIDWLSGLCPVQGEGMVNGHPFYFRARGQRWMLWVAKPNGDPLDTNEVVFTATGVYKDAGYMPGKVARRLIESSAEQFVTEYLLVKPSASPKVEAEPPAPLEV